MQLSAAKRPAGFEQLGATERFMSLAFSLGCLAVLVTAAWLHPSEKGHGTHVQLGLWPCSWPTVVGGPCPTCGMTTAFAHAAHGEFVSSFISQPFGFLLALATGAAFWAGLHMAATGSRLGRIYGKLLRPRVLWTLAGLALAAWAYKWATWPR